MIKMPRRTNKDIIRDILLSSDEPLSAEEISQQWPYNSGLSTGSLAQLLIRMKDIQKVGQRNAQSICNDSYPVDTWTHINHKRYAEWVEKSTNE